MAPAVALPAALGDGLVNVHALFAQVSVPLNLQAAEASGTPIDPVAVGVYITHIVAPGVPDGCVGFIESV